LKEEKVNGKRKKMKEEGLLIV